MSWDADLITKDVDGNDVYIRDFNYTHNMNHAINEALGNPEVPTYWAKQFGGMWWTLLDDKTAEEVRPILQGIVDEMEARPDQYKAMEPDNKWGSLETLIPVLKEMADLAKEYPSARWKFSG